MKISHLFEAERAITAIRQYRDRPDMFITFTDILKVGINPSTEWSDPIGVYTYPIREMLNEFEDGFHTFGASRPYIHIVRSMGTMLELQAVPKKLFKTGAKTLTEKFGNADLMTYNIEMFNLSRSAGERLWRGTHRIALDLSQKLGRDPRIIWNKIFVTLGFDAVADRGEGIISENEPAQAVFLKPAALRVVQAIPNDLFAIPRSAPTPLSRD